MPARKNHGLGVEDLEPVLGADDVHASVAANFEHHGVQAVLDAEGFHLADEAFGVFRPGQLLLEDVQAEAVVDALLEDASQFPVPLEDQDAAGSALVRFDGRRPGRRALRPR